MERSSAKIAEADDDFVVGPLRKPRHCHVFETLLGEISAGRFQPGDKLPTEAELAKTFSASRSTVSRAIRDLKNKGLLNRQRRGGTHITLPQSQHIALFTPFTRSASDLGYIGGQIHAHLSDLAARRGDHLRLQIIDAAADGDCLEPMLAAARALIQQGVAGVFYYPAELPKEQARYNQTVVDRLQAAGIAVVAVDRDIVAPPERSKLPLVTFDNRRGGHLVTRHLIRRGCKRIAFVGSPWVSSVGSARQRGYVDALQDHGLPIDASLLRSATISELDYNFCERLVREARPDAIVCKMDHYAAAIGRHLVNLGVSIGQDILLAGFDDEPFAELLPVPLTTIRFPAEPFAQTCFDRMATQLATPTTPVPGMTLIDIELIVRESTSGPCQRQNNDEPVG